MISVTKYADNNQFQIENNKNSFAYYNAGLILEMQNGESCAPDTDYFNYANRQINISGNSRVSNETIKIYGDIKINENYTEQDLNLSLIHI